MVQSIWQKPCGGWQGFLSSMVYAGHMGISKEERLQLDEAEDPVLFYSAGDLWGQFSNFSFHAVTLPHPFTHEPFTYATGEHRFQAMKGTNRQDHDYVAKAESPSATKGRGREILLREDWGNTEGAICWYVMLETVLAKALQHWDVRDTLFATGDRHIYEDSPSDDIWGWRYRYSYSGKNLLGRAWMHARTMLDSIA